MDAHENDAKYNIAETCCASVSVNDLQKFSDDPSASPLDLSRKLTYGAIRGSDKLRTNLAALYSSDSEEDLSPEGIIITPGAIQANFEVFYALVGRGDHVICVYPTYQQLYAVPESLGAEVSLWRLNDYQGFVPDTKQLRSLVKPNTKLIVIK